MGRRLCGDCVPFGEVAQASRSEDLECYRNFLPADTIRVAEDRGIGDAARMQLRLNGMSKNNRPGRSWRNKMLRCIENRDYLEA